jgi:hypothetical protein
MQSLLSLALKDNLNLRLGYLTGIHYISFASFYGLLNNIFEYTVMNNQFSQYFGFTKDEVTKLLVTYGAHSKIDEMEKRYGGYKFGKDQIYNPSSILKYLDNNFEPKSYWINTAENSLVSKVLLNINSTDQENSLNFVEHDQISAKIDKILNLKLLDSSSQAFWSFLLAAGYLTIASGPDEKYRYKLIAPNIEIKECINSMFESKLTEIFTETFGDYKIFEQLIENFINGNIIAFQKSIISNMKQIILNFNSENIFFYAFILGFLWLKKDQFQLKRQSDKITIYYGDTLIYPRRKGSDPSIIIKIEEVYNLSENKEEIDKQILRKFQFAFAEFSTLKYEAALEENSKVCKILKYVFVLAGESSSCILQVNNENTLSLGDGRLITVDELTKVKF